MPDLVWSEAKSFFDAGMMGRLPDLYVPETSIADWQALLPGESLAAGENLGRLVVML